MNELIRLMEKVESPGTFAVSGTLASIPPGLTVKGLGTVSLPLLETQAKAMIELSEQAPFGRGEETLVDTTVRNVWQISAADFELTNPQWQESLQVAIHDQIGQPLGLHGCEIQCEPYKLLIYEKGSFFKAHRDTEKIPNMFATLVINLPSEHEGGELIVSHGGHHQHYSFANQDLFHSQFLAFYADCYHEVKPITSGYRLCLIYNLAITNRKQQPLLSQSLKRIEDIHHYIQKWTQQTQENPILCYLLEHSYSEKNLTLSNLKNGDSSKAIVLLTAAEQNNCQAFLCLVTYCRTSYGESVYYGRYAYGNDDLTEAEFEEYDVDQEEIYAHALITAQGDKLNVQKLSLEENQLLAKVPLLDGPGRTVSISEATGNEGATKELWYHRGAVIVWPKDRDLDMVKKMDIHYGIHYLKTFLQDQDVSQGENRQKAIQLATSILDDPFFYSCDEIAPELIKLGDLSLLKTFIDKRISQYYNLKNSNTSLLLQILETFGWKSFEPELGALVMAKANVLPWINSLVRAPGSLSSEGMAVLKTWFESIWQSSLNQRLTSEELSTILQLVSIFKLHTATDILIEFLSQQRQPSFVTDLYGPSVLNAMNALNALDPLDYDRKILNTVIRNLRQRIKKDFPSAPKKPKDWVREGSLSCRCEFCTPVNQFLPDPVQSEITVEKTLKRNLVHLASEIEKSQVELELEIIRVSPKFQGLCRKTQRSFDHQLQLFNQAQNLLKQLSGNSKSTQDFGRA